MLMLSLDELNCPTTTTRQLVASETCRRALGNT